MASVAYEKLSGSEKAAIVILSLPPDAIRKLLSRMENNEVERILAAVSRCEEISPTVQEKVLADFREAIGSGELSIRGGRHRAFELVNSTLEPDRAEQIVEKLGRDERRVDWTLRNYTPEFIAAAIADEHPQTIAVILAQIPADRGAAVIAALPDTVQPDVVLRLADLETVSGDTIMELEEELAVMFEREVGASARLGGTEVAAKLLNGVPKSECATIMEGVDTKAPELAGEIRKRMLTFNDLEGVDSRGFQTLLREIPTEDLVIALKTATDEMREKVFSNVSSRAAEQLREESDLLPPMKLSEVERVQMEIVDVARRLEEEGRLTIDTGGGGDDVLV
ncbi:MAG: flagellar motor switch protein FliG [Proteobacteria bacterium]|nr:flagellar motor switch protein FliG [Pseudomonadota bacterium]